MFHVKHLFKKLYNWMCIINIKNAQNFLYIVSNIKIKPYLDIAKDVG